jgi:hypothetical protein
MSQTPRQAAGQLGGLITRSRYDGRTMTAPARAAQLARFGQQVDETATARGETLSPSERAARIEALRRAHCARMRLARKAAR